MARETTIPARSAPPPQKRATPLARRIALEHGIDLGGIDGTGAGGGIRAADVRALVGQLPPAPLLRASPPGPLSPAAGAVAAPSSAAASGSPGLRVSGSPASGSPGLPVETLTFEVDVTDALAAAGAARAPAGRQALPVGLAAVVVAEAAGLLAGHPELNGAWGGELAVLRRRAHVALGEAGPAGLRWAVVADAGDLTARGVARAVAGGVGDGGAATFAVVSLAEGASWQSAAPPLPGTAAALSVGAPAPRLVCWGEGVAIRALATMTLSYDARLVDGRRAAGFLRALRERLEGLPTRGASARVL